MTDANEAKLREPLKRFAPIALVLGAVAIVVGVVPKAPHDRDVELRLTDPASVTRVEIAWFEEGAAAPLRTGVWRFERGKAPASLSTRFQGADGRYVVETAIDRSEDHHEERRTVDVNADAIALPLR